MPGHGTGLGAGNFPKASKLLQRYEHDRAYKLHMQKLHSVRHRLDVEEPKKQNHLVLRLKQIQKEEERQAEIDHENKILLNKMTHVLKYGGNIDNWNNYESRSLNYPFREKQNGDIARENIGIARRLETVKPKLTINKWEREYQQHQYLKRLWSDSVKDFGEFTPRRYRSRMSRTVQRSLENSLDDTYDEDFRSIDTSEDKKLPKLKKDMKKKEIRTAKSESSVPVTHKKDESKAKASTKLPKIVAHKALVERDYSMYYRDKTVRSAPASEENGVSGQGKDSQDDKSDIAQLFKIAKQLGKPEDIFIKTLIKKSHKQRMVTKEKFRQKYDLDLVTELKNGLGQPWEYLIDALLQEKGVADSYAVFDALSTADMCDVVELLCSRDNATIAELKESYRKEFSISLEEDVADRSKPPIQTILLALQKGVRDETPDVDHEAARKDAQAIYEYGEGCWDSEDGIFIKLLNERSFAHLEAVFSEYKTVSQGQDIQHAMKKECAKDYYKLLSTLVQCIGSPASYYAEQLHRHKLPTDPVFVGTLTLRSEIDMPEVRKAYKKMFTVDITEDIKSKAHPTQKCLIELACKVPPGSKKKADAKKTYIKDGAAEQQSHPTPAQAKKPPAGKKSEPKVKGQGQSESGDTVKSTKTDNDAMHGKKSEPKQAQQSKSNNQESKKAATGASNGNHRGTVKSASNFRPEDDCDRLNSAMSGERADESVIVSILPRRSNKQRQQLKATYEQKYKKNLMIDLTSEMTGDWEEIVLALMMTPAKYDAHVTQEAVEGLGTAEPTLVAILCTRSAQELKDIKEHYRKGTNGDFDMDVTRDCGADLKNLLLHLARGERVTGTAVNVQQAQKDAKDLHQNGIRSDTFVEIVSKQNHFQVQATFDEYKKVAGEDIYASITKASLGDDEDVYISIAKAVEDPVQFYAEKLHGCFTSMGTNDNLLIRMVIPRSEVDLEDIKLRYFELYSRTLYDAVNGQCQGDYKAMLLAVINNDEENGKGQQKKPVKQKTTKKDDVQKSVTGGTVKPAKPFNPVDDSERLNGAMSGFGTDETVIVNILPHRTNDQRQEIKAKYQDKYNKNLQDQLESELRGDFEEIVLALMMKPVDYACHSLHESVKGLGTKEGILIGVLCTKTGKELAVIKNRYKEIYGKDLQQAITEDVSGGMEEMFVEMLKCERSQAETVNIQEAKDDAKRLYKEGQISIDPTDEVFKSVIARKSRVQVRATFQEYKKLTGNDIYIGIEKALIGDDEDAYIGLARAVEDPVWFYAEALHSCFDGFGTNDTRLIRIIVARSEIDLADIKAKYKSLYNKTVSERVEQESKGDYKTMLLAILGDHNEASKERIRSGESNTSQNAESSKAKRQVSVVLPDPDKSETGSVFEDQEIGAENDNEVTESENDKITTEINSAKESGKGSADLKGNGDENKKDSDTSDKEKTEDEKNNMSEKDSRNKQQSEKGKVAQSKKKTSKGSAKTNKESAKKIKGADKKNGSKTDGKNKSTKKRSTDRLKTAESFTQYDLNDVEDEDTEDSEAIEDCRKLNEAMHAKRTNKEDINEILSELSDKQRRAIREAYRNRYDKELLDDIKHELNGPHLLLVQSLFKDQSLTDAENIYNAVSGFGTDESLLIYLLISRTTQEISDIKKHYVKLYGRELATDVTNETSGAFRKLCLQLVNKEEQDDARLENEDLEIAEQNVQKLWKPGDKLEQSKNNDILIDVMSQCSFTQYRMVSNLYMKECGVSFPETIVRTTKGSFQEALLSLASYFAAPIDYHCQNVTRVFKGFRNNDRLLISTLLPNLETNTQAMQEAYLKRYNRSLENVIRSNCGSGDYGKLWLKLIARKEALDQTDATDIK